MEFFFNDQHSKTFREYWMSLFTTITDILVLSLLWPGAKYLFVCDQKNFHLVHWRSRAFHFIFFLLSVQETAQEKDQKTKNILSLEKSIHDFEAKLIYKRTIRRNATFVHHWEICCLKGMQCTKSKFAKLQFQHSTHLIYNLGIYIKKPIMETLCEFCLLAFHQ